MAKWLIKSEPDECGIDDFANAPDRVIPWDGVRNYQARNFLRQMDEGDQVLFYHSSCQHIGIAGVVSVVRAAYPDPTQFDPLSPYHDPKATREKPRWDAVDMRFVCTLPRIIPLAELKAIPALESMHLVRKGNRLSVMPVTDDEWAAIPDQDQQP